MQAAVPILGGVGAQRHCVPTEYPVEAALGQPALPRNWKARAVLRPVVVVRGLLHLTPEVLAAHRR